MRDNHASAIAIDMSDWVRAFNFANLLLRAGKRVMLVTEQLLPDTDALPVGSLVLQLDKGDELRPLEAAAREAGLPLQAVPPTVSVVVQPLSAIRVGLYGGGGAPFNHASVLAAAGFQLRFISDAEVRAGDLDTIDVFVMPGGGFRAMHGQLEPLGIDGAQALADWVRAGGMYIGSCAGAFDCAITSESFKRGCPGKTELQLINARVWNEGLGELEGLQSPGVGVVRIRNERPDHPVMFGMPEEFPIVHYNGPVFEVFADAQIEGASLASSLATFVGREAKFTHAEAFMGDSNSQVDTVLDRAIANERASIVAGEFGLGRVVAFGSHPEFGFDLGMAEWDAPARMLVNAVAWQAANQPRRSHAPSGGCAARSGPVSFPGRARFQILESEVMALRARVASLQQRAVDPTPHWLTNAYAMSFFGTTPTTIWTESLADLDRLSSVILEHAASLRDILDRLADAAPADRAVIELLRQIDAWFLDRRDPNWRQDGGYEGAVRLVATAVGMCDEALARWDAPLGDPEGPYGHFRENPYHLVAGSYLAAIGCVVGATQLLRALNDEAAIVVRTVVSRLGADVDRHDASSADSPKVGVEM